MRTIQILAVLALGASACLLAGADKAAPKPAAELPEIKELPNPFAFAKRGFAVAECNFSEAALDSKDKARSVGVYKLFDDKIDCGGLMAWAWCVSRTIDAIEEVKEIDAKRVIVTGHSRYGKTALVA